MCAAGCPGAAPAGRARDTSSEAERVQVELWRRMSALDKARILSEITRTVQELSLVGIRERHPGASDGECMLRLALLKLGPALTSRVYPEAAGLIGS